MYVRIVETCVIGYNKHNALFNSYCCQAQLQIQLSCKLRWFYLRLLQPLQPTPLHPPNRKSRIIPTPTSTSTPTSTLTPTSTSTYTSIKLELGTNSASALSLDFIINATFSAEINDIFVSPFIMEVKWTR